MQDTQKNLYKKLLGRDGELKAVKYLKKQGYKILDKNLKNAFAEIDILAKKDGELYFCEVKTRTSDTFGTPAMAVDSKKQIKYRKFAENYVQTTGYDGNVHFLVVEVYLDKINVIEDAF